MGDGEEEDGRRIVVGLIWGICGALGGWTPAAAILAKEGLLGLMPGSTDEAIVSSVVVEV